MKLTNYFWLLGAVALFLLIGFFIARGMSQPTYWIDKEYAKNQDVQKYEDQVQDSNDLTTGSGNTIVRTTVTGDNNQVATVVGNNNAVAVGDNSIAQVFADSYGVIGIDMVKWMDLIVLLTVIGFILGIFMKMTRLFR